VQDCLWDAGLLRAASAMDLQSRTLKSTQWAETKKYHNIAGPGNFTNYKTYLKIRWKRINTRHAVLVPDPGNDNL
jgi:hypothetical protein